jgi:para-nitrobenzyl esterase
MDHRATLSRRAFVASAALGPFMFAAGPTRAAVPVTVEVANGKLRGLRENGAISFKGIPYAADTGGKNRFMAPRPVRNWAGVRDATRFGDRCPQAGAAGAEDAANQGPAYSENCCVLNVYSPDTNRNARRPVMVYIHGGGFHSGAGDSPSIDGRNLAKFGDVVVVTVNHRINVFGYTNLGFLDPDFTDAANAGQLDLIAALKWVRNNIASFGGDPGRVMLFGVSGGGSKIVTLSIMRGAQGLFHRSINMSGTSAYAMEPASASEDVTRELLKRLNINDGGLRKLQEIPSEQLLTASAASLAALNRPASYRPVIDARHIHYSPLSVEGLAMQAAMPIVMTSTATEATWLLAGDPRNVQVTPQQVKRRISAQFSLDDAKAAAIMDAYQRVDPDRSAWDVLVAIGTDAMIRVPMRQAADALANTGRSPVYVSQFTWRSPADGGIWGAPHAIDVPFAFGNLDVHRLTAGGGPQAWQTSLNQMSAFAAFAGSANPNNDRMPGWTPYNATQRSIMVVDETCQLVPDFGGGDRLASEALPEQDPFTLVSGPLFRYA